MSTSESEDVTQDERDHAAHLEGECNTAVLAGAGWTEHLPPAQTRDFHRNK